jgi:hypothetical protein
MNLRTRTEAIVLLDRIEAVEITRLPAVAMTQGMALAWEACCIRYYARRRLRRDQHRQVFEAVEVWINTAAYMASRLIR